MNIQSIDQDIKRLEQALKAISKTENYLHFNKSALMAAISEQINVLKDKRDKQTAFIQSFT